MEKKYLLLACVALFSQLHIYSKEQQSINLGDTPWKFSKVIRQETNLAKDASILYGLQKVSEINDDDGMESRLFIRKTSIHRSA